MGRAAAFPSIGSIESKGDKAVLCQAVGVQPRRLFLDASSRVDAEDGRIAFRPVKIFRQEKVAY